MPSTTTSTGPRAGCNSHAVHVRTADDEHQPILAERFKTKLCENFELRGGKCPYEQRCMFAHGEHELRDVEQNLADGLTTEAAIKAFRKRQRGSAKKAAAAVARIAAAAATAAESDAPASTAVGPPSPPSKPGSIAPRGSGLPLPRSQQRSVPAPRSLVAPRESAASMAGVVASDIMDSGSFSYVVSPAQHPHGEEGYPVQTGAAAHRYTHYPCHDDDDETHDDTHGSAAYADPSLSSTSMLSAPCYAPYRSSSSPNSGMYGGSLHAMQSSLMMNASANNASFASTQSTMTSATATTQMMMTGQGSGAVCPTCQQPRQPVEPKQTPIDLSAKISEKVGGLPNRLHARWVTQLCTPNERRVCRCSEEQMLQGSTTFFVG